jgi:hypothetical protein
LPTKQTKPPARAAALIAQAKAGAVRVTPPSAAALADLKALIDHNDSVSSSGPGRVVADTAIKMLQEYGWRGNSRKTLDALCAAQFGRRTYGTK